ncbi:hypothetical protein TrLO_g9487, partial [Triparma laevis f. longispina]
MACITTCATLMYAYFAYSSDEDEKAKIAKFWGWSILPIFVTTMAISFMLKPRREDRKYKTLLYIQYFVLSYVSEFLSLIGKGFKKGTVGIFFLKGLVLYPALLILGMKLRSHIAKLTNRDLSYFLTNDVVMGGAFIGLGQLAFLMFASIRCENANDDWKECRRILTSQVGLSAMVGLYVIIKLASGVVPKYILEKHTISVKKLAAMKMNTEEFVLADLLLMAIGCALFMLGNYGTEGDIHNDEERILLFTVMFTGLGCLLVTAVWKVIVIRGELWRGELSYERRHIEAISSTSEEFVLTEASSFWICVAVLLTTLESNFYVASAITLDDRLFTIASMAFPIVALAFVASFFCQPRRHSPKDMLVLRLHGTSFFYVSLGANVVRDYRNKQLPWAVAYFALTVLLTIFFHFGFKLRANIGRLPDKDLETFLVNTLGKGLLKTSFSVLFLLFRTTKCAFEKGFDVREKGGTAKCFDTSWCALCIAIYLICWFVMNLVGSSVRSEWRNDLNLSIEKIAQMSHISLRRGLAGLLTLVTGVCAIFLFSLMSAKEMDEMIIRVIGISGIGASFGVLTSEIYSSLKAQSRRARAEIEIAVGKKQDQQNYAELAAKMRERRGVPLVEDQEPVFKRCEELLENGWDDWGSEWEEWRAGGPMSRVRSRAVSNSKSPDVKMQMKYLEPKTGEGSIATGKAVGVVDCSTEEAASSIISVCSNEKLRVNREEGNPARVELREKARENERVYAMVHKFPFPLANREFVFRMISKSEEEKALVAFESVGDEVDYEDHRVMSSGDVDLKKLKGSRVELKRVRAFTRGLWLFEDLPVSDETKQCRMTYVVQIDAGGYIPTWLVNKKMPETLGAVQDAIDEFRTDADLQSRQIENTDVVSECSWIFT